MEQQQVQTNMLGRRVHWDGYGTPQEGVVVAAWIQQVREGRNYPYNDGHRATRIFFLLESDDGSLHQCKAIDTKTVAPCASQKAE